MKKLFLFIYILLWSFFPAIVKAENFEVINCVNYRLFAKYHGSDHVLKVLQNCANNYFAFYNFSTLQNDIEFITDGKWYDGNYLDTFRWEAKPARVKAEYINKNTNSHYYGKCLKVVYELEDLSYPRRQDFCVSKSGIDLFLYSGHVEGEKIFWQYLYTGHLRGDNRK